MPFDTGFGQKRDYLFNRFLGIWHAERKTKTNKSSVVLPPKLA